MDKTLNQKGFTLIEVVLAIAILGIISISFLNIFNSSGINIFGSGVESQDVQEAKGEMDRVAQDHTYRGKEDSKSVAAKYEKVRIFNEIDIDVVSLKSKIGDKKESLKIGDPYLFLFMTEEGSLHSGGKPFISKDGDYEFGPGDIIVPEAELQGGSYKWNESGVLVIPKDSEINIEKDKKEISWSVKEGIAIFESINFEKSNGTEFKLESSEGDIDIHPGVALEPRSFTAYAKANIYLNGTTIDAKNGNGKIILEAKGEIDVRGSDGAPTQLEVHGNGNGEIIFKAGTEATPTKIYSNNYTKFESKEGEKITAINDYGATLEGGKLGIEKEFYSY